MKRRRNLYVFTVCVLVFLYYFCGVSDYVFSRDFDSEFDYPLNTDIRPIVVDILAGYKPSVTPINIYPYRFLSNSGKCNAVEKLDLFILVKSAMNHFQHRKAIRQTYGQESYLPGRIVKILFFLGINDMKSQTQRMIEKEIDEHNDIIQIDFHDNYYNNTFKTMMSFRWAYEHCSTADYYLFTDDDMYISVSNLLNYVSEQPPTGLSTTFYGNERDRLLFAGYVFKSAPHRYITSKWRVSIDEYPWNRWPPYVTAGAYVLSNKAIKIMYIGSLYVKHFRFDDIYLGIVAKKVGIEPTHCPHFYFYKKKYSKEDYSEVIASHGYSDHSELVRVWNEQNRII
ncbi:beta-1,3-galactosyltransferase brn-like isoform X1 [Cydia fagiglandana]|uniref:beta-1,3-galactosyltransferase brn-like isoform X1 n=1 Tax=Cydia fagiglandana TaxID=1458189 RepID=UPI002FEE40F0